MDPDKDLKTHLSAVDAWLHEQLRSWTKMLQRRSAMTPPMDNNLLEDIKHQLNRVDQILGRKANG